MGDRWLDSEKLTAGFDAVERVTPVTGWQQWLVWLGWSEQQWWERTTTNSAGYTHYYANLVTNRWPYSSAAEAADFLLRTRTDRSSLLTIADSCTTNYLPVPPGEHTFRLRSAFGGLLNLSLDPTPGALAEIPDATNGLWICQMELLPYDSATALIQLGELPNSNNIPVSAAILFVLDNNTTNGTIRPLATSEEARLFTFAEDDAALIQPLGGVTTGATSSMPAITAIPLQAGGGVYDLGMRCPCEGCDSWPRYSDYMFAKELAQKLPGGTANKPGDYLMELDEAQEMLQPDPTAIFTVRRRISSPLYPFMYQEVKFDFTTCLVTGTELTVTGAEAPENIYGHAPGEYGLKSCPFVNCNCSEHKHIVIGFDHGKVNTRNILPELEADDDDTTDHCIGLIWSKGGTTNLYSLLHDNCQPYIEHLSFSSSNGDLSVTPEGVLSFGSGEPSDMKPSISLIKLHYKLKTNVDIIFDRLWVVVNSTKTEKRYSQWYIAQSSTNWMIGLPRPHKNIVLTTNLLTSAVSPIDPEPGAPDKWAAPHAVSTYLHHDAAYEMRSHPVAGGYGHQAMYCASGKLLVEPIAAGSADLFAPYNADGTAQKNTNHRNYDVYPFIRALQLDGNPVQKVGTIVGIDAPQNLDRPAIFKGLNINRYVERRPVLP